MTVALVVLAEILVCGLVAVVSPASWLPWSAFVPAALAAAALASPRVRPALRPSAYGRRGIRSARPDDAGLEVIDLVAADGSFVGCVDRSPVIVTALEVGSGAHVVTTIGREGPPPFAGRRIPLDVLAGMLGGPGPCPTGIDVCVLGRRSVPGPLGAVHDRLVGPLAVIAHRTVVVLLRWDLTDLLTGDPGRDDDADVTARGVVAATGRVHRALVHHGFPGRVLDGHELAAFLLDHGGPGPATTATLTSADLLAGAAQRCWDVPAAAVGQVVRLRPGASAREPDRVSVTVGIQDPAHVPDALTRGRIETHLLPDPTADDPADRPDGVPVDPRVLTKLAPPAHGTGQILGATEDGRALALLVAGPHLRTVLVAGDRALSRQVVLRAVASGHRLAVRTDEPAAWRPMVDAVADERRLRLDATDQPAPDSPTDAVVWDRDEPLTAAHVDALVRPGGREAVPPTVVRILGPGADGGYPGFDEALAAAPDLVLDGRVAGWISVEPRGGQAIAVRVVDGPGEDAFALGRDREADRLDTLAR